MRAQRRSARGTVGHPYSALNLRLVLASFGLVACTALAVIAWRVGLGWLAVALLVLAATAVVDIVVVQLRRRARQREDGGHHSLFE